MKEAQQILEVINRRHGYVWPRAVAGKRSGSNAVAVKSSRWRRLFNSVISRLRLALICNRYAHEKLSIKISRLTTSS